MLQLSCVFQSKLKEPETTAKNPQESGPQSLTSPISYHAEHAEHVHTALNNAHKCIQNTNTH